MKCLEHEPDPTAPERTTPAFGEARDVDPVQADTSRRSAGRADPSRCSRVDLPEPDGPMIDRYSPRSIRRLTSLIAVTGGFPGNTRLIPVSFTTADGGDDAPGAKVRDG